uniref:Ribosomal protein S11 n=1 Tax=Davidia involucrata TaxID=16924 RepID=A0A5B7BX85_DAVIN
MIAQRSISRFYGRAGLFDRAFGIFSPRSDRSFNALLCASKNSDQSRCIENLKGTSSLHDDVAAGANVNVLPQFLGNLGMKLGFMKVKENVSPPCAMHFRSFIHSSNRNELETGRNSRSMDFVRGIIEENGKDIMAGLQLSRYEKNADIVHIKLIRNNTFVTVTDSKGNKKAGASSGSLSEMKGGAKVSRYAAEATAEHVGRLARNLGLKSVVVKVNGFTYFKKKKQAILNFREGYTFSRGDQNPIVHIEDTTRRPHNGCRLRKKRRV